MRTWSPKATRWAAALAVLLACGSAWADLLGEPLPPIPPPEVKPLPSAPEEPAPQEPPAEPAPPPRSGLRRENVLLIGGEPQALFWADGLAQAEDLPAYKALGFNAVRVPVTSAGGEALARAERLAEAAEQAGLFVLADLRPEGAAFETEGAGAPHSPLDVSYRAAVRRFVRAAAPRLLARKTLAGWVVSGVDAEAVHYSQSDFWSYLQVWHGGLSEINAAWGSAFPTALHITDAAIEKLDAGRTGGVGRRRWTWRGTASGSTPICWGCGPTRFTRWTARTRCWRAGCTTTARRSRCRGRSSRGACAGSSPGCARPTC